MLVQSPTPAAQLSGRLSRREDALAPERVVERGVGIDGVLHDGGNLRHEIAVRRRIDGAAGFAALQVDVDIDRGS